MSEATSKKCGDCVYFQTADGCHRFPPTAVWIGHESKAVYPKVTKDQVSCGEFQQVKK